MSSNSAAKPSAIVVAIGAGVTLRTSICWLRQSVTTSVRVIASDCLYSIGPSSRGRSGLLSTQRMRLISSAAAYSITGRTPSTDSEDWQRKRQSWKYSP